MADEESSRASSKEARGDELAGVSAFAARILNQLSLGAWLPAAFLTVCGSLLLEFRAQRSLNIAVAVSTLTRDRVRVLILTLPILIITTLVTQAFSFEAIRTLEGYWHRRGPASAMRSLMIRLQVRRKQSLIRRRARARALAFATARPRLLAGKVPHAIVNALEADALGTPAPLLTALEQGRFEKMSWRSKCDSWRLARVDHLVLAERDYPALSRVLPTRLGNVIRATEDRLRNAGQDIEGFALRRRDLVSSRVQQQHDQFRTPLDMYCILVFVSAFLGGLTLVLLYGRSINKRAVAAVAAAFALMTFASYQAAIASARGYCAALRQMDEVVTKDGRALRLP